MNVDLGVLAPFSEIWFETDREDFKPRTDSSLAALNSSACPHTLVDTATLPSHPHPTQFFQL